MLRHNGVMYFHIREEKIRVIDISRGAENPCSVQGAVKTEISRYAAAFWRQTRLSSRDIKRHVG